MDAQTPPTDAEWEQLYRVAKLLQIGLCPACNTVHAATSIIRGDSRLADTGLTCPSCRFFIPYKLFKAILTRDASERAADIQTFLTWEATQT